MLRQPHLDAPGTLHHVMVRGLERRPIFREDADRADFVVMGDVAKYVKLLSPALAVPCLPLKTPSAAAHAEKY